MSAYLVISTQIKTVPDSEQNEDTYGRLFHSGAVAVWLQHQQLGGLQQLFNQVTRELQAVCLFLHECVTLQASTRYLWQWIMESICASRLSL